MQQSRQWNQKCSKGSYKEKKREDDDEKPKKQEGQKRSELKSLLMVQLWLPEYQVNPRL